MLEIEKKMTDCTQTTRPTGSNKGLLGHVLSHPLDLATLDFPDYNGHLTDIAVPSSPATMSPVVIHKTSHLKKKINLNERSGQVASTL